MKKLFKSFWKGLCNVACKFWEGLCNVACKFWEGLCNVVYMHRYKLAAFFAVCMFTCLEAAAQTGDYSQGTAALSTVTTEIAKYIPIVTKLCYAIAGIVAILGAISVYIAMNNEEQDVKKKIMMVVGACLFLIAAAQALPAFFGVGQ